MLPAERLQVSISTAIACGVAALVIVPAPLEQGDLPALEFADHQPPLVAGDRGLRKAGNLGVGNRDRILGFVGERPEARSPARRRAAAAS